MYSINHGTRYYYVTPIGALIIRLHKSSCSIKVNILHRLDLVVVLFHMLLIDADGTHPKQIKK